MTQILVNMELNVNRIGTKTKDKNCTLEFKTINKRSFITIEATKYIRYKDKLNQKTYRFEKKEYIGSTAQKKSNKITKFLISAFL